MEEKHPEEIQKESLKNKEEANKLIQKLQNKVHIMVNALREELKVEMGRNTLYS
jgi:hypothetical protein